MGLFDLFGGRKKAEEEAAQSLEQQKEEAHKKTVEEQKAAHEGLPWPSILRLNVVNTGAQVKVEDPISAERKDEIGQLVYEPDLKLEQIENLNLQELTFLMGTMEVFNQKAPLKNFAANHRVCHNELLRRVQCAEKIYIIYDKRTGYPLLDTGCALIYLDKEHADLASKMYNAQFRDTVVVERPGVNVKPDENGRTPMSVFDFLYYIGAENLLVDNGWYKALVGRTEISAPPIYNVDPKKEQPAAPRLAFAMLDFVQEIRWPVKYQNRDKVILRKQNRMFDVLKTSRLVVPMSVIPAKNPGEKPEARLPIANNKDKKFLPVFTDFLEYGRKFGPQAGEAAKAFHPMGVQFSGIENFLNGDAVDGILINGGGEGIIIPNTKIKELLHPKEEGKVIQMPNTFQAQGAAQTEQSDGQPAAGTDAQQGGASADAPKSED